MSFVLARPSLHGDYFGGPVQAFLAGLMLLAGLILLAACANLGSLFAARAADRSREVALRLAMGAGRIRILRQLFTEAALVSLTGGAVGLWCSLILLRGLGTWQPTLHSSEKRDLKRFSRCGNAKTPRRGCQRELQRAATLSILIFLVSRPSVSAS